MKDSDSKRSFSHDRLYKLVKRLVIIVSVLTWIYIALIYTSLENDTSLNSWKYWEEFCSEYPIASDEHITCKITSYKFIDEAKNNMENALKIGILLPITFFGGTWLYRYLFPKNNQ